MCVLAIMILVDNLTIEGFYHPSEKYHLDLREEYAPIPAPVVWVYTV